ncbi:sensor histidine kinase [Psychroflexus planctonicus]|uniref:histidine kinase n=1 Tax=Psychroflexus planctonicus TaxID=1526575 RepID=A0ABQ1SJD6_9FLAO|nr:HAMP domain-containing sensor histidine kinase [Psychroflexus planctonicus]GGE37959.1 two-component sensor histidine kinase [Psychroflexus planctonicus]
MELFKNKAFARWFIILSSITIVGLIIWNITVFYNRIKDDERSKMMIWTSAMKSVSQADLEGDEVGLELEILQANESIPIISVDQNGDPALVENVPKDVVDDPVKFDEFLNRIKTENIPIEIDLGDGMKQVLYYGNSQILNKIKYYPLILFVIVALFSGLLYFFYVTSRTSEQNKLWAGMAKETAHQIGTPLSSLFGWLEILKAEGVNQEYIDEIEKDIDRLKTITERFSKVGSKLKLEKTDITLAAKNSFEYLQSRSSKLIEFQMDLPQEPVFVMLNEPLFSWTIENLTKNAIDAMKGKGKLEMELARSGNWVKILVKDTGKGIPLKNFNKVFQPGFSTKKRGWGLGLSLAKRIIEDYHDGKIRIIYSELGKGSTFEIRLRKIED